jgi:ERF superfamily
MPARRTTTTQPTPLEEVEPTAPAPEPTPEPTPQPDPATEAPADAAPRNPLSLMGWVGLPGRITGLPGSAAADEGDYPLTVHEAIAEVTRRVEHIGKDRRATGGGANYAFRGIDDVYDALHPILGDVGLVILPGRSVREVWETRATSSGGTLNVARLLIRYTFVGPDGSKLRAEVWGEAGDSGDKATQKAHSQSYKTLCLQTFSIPTQASADDDPDATNPPARPFTDAQRQRATRAWVAAQEATEAPALFPIHRQAQAEGLLGVPVVMMDGTVPLGALLERRLAQLQEAPPAGDSGDGGAAGEQS